MMNNEGQTPAVQDEIGAADNRFQWDPTDDNFAATKNWKDGQRYRRVVMDIEQVSPGEARVLSVVDGGTPDSQATDESEQVEETAPAAETAEPAGSPNPAVARMMAQEKY